MNAIHRVGRVVALPALLALAYAPSVAAAEALDSPSASSSSTAPAGTLVAPGESVSSDAWLQPDGSAAQSTSDATEPAAEPDASAEAPDTDLSAPPPAPNLRARFFTSPAELREELAVHEIASRLYAGAELEAQSDWTRQGKEHARDSYFDAITGALRWVPMYGLVGTFEGSYDLQSSEGFSIEEFTLTLGGVPTEPWYVSVGRTTLPFGEFNSHFREDPSTQTLGEMQGDQIAGGYESDRFEFTLAGKRAQPGSRANVWFANITFSPVNDMDVGVFWTSDLTQSTEIRQLLKEAHAADPTVIQSAAVHGGGAFMSLQKDTYSIDVEYIAALSSFQPAAEDVAVGKPWAVNFEATYRPTNPWELGLRYEHSSGLPDSPDTQVGVETSYGFNQHFAMSLEFLHGSFGADAPDRNLISIAALVIW